MGTEGLFIPRLGQGAILGKFLEDTIVTIKDYVENIKEAYQNSKTREESKEKKEAGFNKGITNIVNSWAKPKYLKIKEKLLTVYDKYIINGQFFKHALKAFNSLAERATSWFFDLLKILFFFAIFDPKGKFLSSIVKFIINMVVWFVKILTKYIPIIIKTIIYLVTEVIPPLLKMVVNSIFDALYTMFDTWAKQFPEESILRQIVETVRDIFGKDSPLRQFLLLLAGLFPVIFAGMGVLALYTKLLPLFGFLKVAFIAIKGALIGLASTLGIAVGWIVLIIAAVVLLGIVIYKNWDVVKKYLIIIKDYVLNKIILPFISFIKEIWNTLKPFIQEIWNTLKPFIQKVKTWFTTTIMPLIMELKNLFVNTFISIFSFIKSIFDKLLTLLKPVFEVLASLFFSLLTLLKPVFEVLISLASLVFEVFQMIIFPIIKTLFKGLLILLTPFIFVLKLVGKLLWFLVKNVFFAFLNIIKVISKVFLFVIPIIKSGLNFVSKFLNIIVGFFNDLKNFGASVAGFNLIKKIGTLFLDLIKSAVLGITKIFDKLFGTNITEYFKKLFDWLTDLFDSFSSYFAGMVQYGPLDWFRLNSDEQRQYRQAYMQAGRSDVDIGRIDEVVKAEGKGAEALTANEKDIYNRVIKSINKETVKSMGDRNVVEAAMTWNKGGVVSALKEFEMNKTNTMNIK